MKDKNDGSYQSYFLPIVLGVLFVASILQKLWFHASVFISHHQTKFYQIGIVLTVAAVTYAFVYLYNKSIDHQTKHDHESTLKKIKVGICTKTKRMICIYDILRLLHTEIIGSTGCGKTEGIIIPWFYADVESGRGVIMIDGKPEKAFLEKIFGKVVSSRRVDDFFLFSLAYPEKSHSFNPFAYGTPTQVAERVFSSFECDNAFYKAIQFSGLITILELIKHLKHVPKPGLIRELLSDKNLLRAWHGKVQDSTLNADLEKIVQLSPDSFEERYAGLLSYLDQFNKCEAAHLFNQDKPEIDLKEILLKNKLVYFQLPTLSSPTLGASVGRLVLQTIAAIAGEIQAHDLRKGMPLFSLYLDDFNDYMYEEFISISSKVRSAGIGMVFSHQSLGDLEKVSPSFKATLIQNTNNKIIMKINEPEAADYFSKYIGTVQKEKTTERRKSGLLGAEDTGDQSVRLSNEFIYHPDLFKSEFGAGDAVAVLEQLTGPRDVQRIKCVPVKESLRCMPSERQIPRFDYIKESQIYGRWTPAKGGQTVAQSNPNVTHDSTPKASEA